MSLPDSGPYEIEKYRNKIEIIRLTADQIIKDFGLFGMEVSFSGDIINAYDELFVQLNSCLIGLLNSDYQKLLSLLYHIDVSEKELNKKLSGGQEATAGIIAEMILEREFKKVIYRKFYKG
ncbi:MAG: hypothetical protein R6U58_11600 [Bacteroidales bacterium]